MSFLSGIKLEKALLEAIGPAMDKGRIKQAAYELTLGSQVYRTDSLSKKRELLTNEDSQVIINPGQFALLITEETIKIPNKLIAFISIKFSQKIKGLVNVSGFHVDPGFEGKIIFSVYNAGPSLIMLDKGKPYFLIWFSTLSSSINYNGLHQGQNEISADIIEQLKGDIASPNALLKKISSLESLLITKTDKIEGRRKYLSWLFQALAIIFAGLFITEFVKHENLETSFQYGKLVGENKISLNEINLYKDSLKRAKDSITILNKNKQIKGK